MWLAVSIMEMTNNRLTRKDTWLHLQVRNSSPNPNNRLAVNYSWENAGLHEDDLVFFFVTSLVTWVSVTLEFDIEHSCLYTSCKYNCNYQILKENVYQFVFAGFINWFCEQWCHDVQVLSCWVLKSRFKYCLLKQEMSPWSADLSIFCLKGNKTDLGVHLTDCNLILLSVASI